MKIVLVEKTGVVKTQNVKNFQINTLYKKCLFRKSDDFMKRHVWSIKVGKNKYNVALYAKNKGKATTENKYDLPPPVDTELYYGSMALVNFNNINGDETDATDFTKEEWEKVYEKLFGGFEDIENTDDEEEEDELENVPKKYLTKKGGYLKDGFVVDTTSEEEEQNQDSEEEEEEFQDEDSDEIKNKKKYKKLSKKNEIVTESDNELDVSSNDDNDDIIDNEDNDGSDDGDDGSDHEDDESDDDDDGSDDDGSDDDGSDDDGSDDDEESDSDSESDNSSELSESVYCDYSDEE